MNTIKKVVGLWVFLTLFDLGNIAAQSQITEKVSMSNIGNKNATYYLLLCKLQPNSKISGTITIGFATNDTICNFCNHCGIEIFASSIDNNMLINNQCDDVNASILTVQYGGDEYFAIELVDIINIANISFTGSSESKSLLLVGENEIEVIGAPNNPTRSGGWDTSGNDIYYTYNGGNVGIGTILPYEKLTLPVNSYIGFQFATDNKGVYHKIGRTFVTTPYDKRYALSYVVTGSDHQYDIMHNFETGNGNALVILENRNVGIGTTTPSHLLTVAGIIGAREVKVETNMGADFVFAPDYPLLPLSELEQFITENKHLPDIAPADTMIQNGVNMGEFQIQLLQKIEELMLYVNELKKEIEELKRQRE